MLALVFGTLERALVLVQYISQRLQHISFLCRPSTPVLYMYKDVVCVFVCVESKDGMSCPHMRVVGGGGGGDGNAV